MYAEKKLTILSTDDALINLTQLSGRNPPALGVTHSITLEWTDGDCRTAATVELEIEAKGRDSAECSWTKRNTHSHEFEIILQRFPQEYTVVDKFKVLNVLHQTFRPEDNFDSFYFVKFEPLGNDLDLI